MRVQNYYRFYENLKKNHFTLYMYLIIISDEYLNVSRST